MSDPVLIDLVIAAAKALTDEELFAKSDGHGNTDGTAAIEYHKATLHPSTQGGLLVPPFCLALERPGSVKAKEYNIGLAYRIHNEDRQAAQADIERLRLLLMGLYEMDSQYLPWELTDDEFFIGEDGSSFQPHPEYCYTVNLQFKRY